MSGSGTLAMSEERARCFESDADELDGGSQCPAESIVRVDDASNRCLCVCGDLAGWRRRRSCEAGLE